MQYLDIIIFAMIAVVIVLRLRSMLGRRTGHERPRDPFAIRRAEETSGDKVVPLPDRARPGRAGEPTVDLAADPLRALRAPANDESQPAGLARIKAADPGFSAEGFVAGARAAFEIIVGAFAAGDADALRPLLSDEVFEKFRTAIVARAKAKETLQTTLVGVTSSSIIDGDMRGRDAVVTMKFVSEQINVTRDAEGRIVDGDPSAVSTVTDIWTFSRNTRSQDPNWTLIATGSPN